MDRDKLSQVRLEHIQQAIDKIELPEGWTVLAEEDKDWNYHVYLLNGDVRIAYLAVYPRSVAATWRTGPLCPHAMNQTQLLPTCVNLMGQILGQIVDLLWVDHTVQ